ERLGHLRRDAGATLEAVVLPAMLSSFVGDVDRHGEGVRLVDDGRTAEVIALRDEVDDVDLVAEPGEPDLQVYVLGRHRPPVGRCPRAVLGRHAGLEYRELEHEVAVRKQTTVVRAAGIGLGAGGRAWL